MNKSLSHISFGKPFASASVKGAYAYWQGQGDCVEYNNLENCKR